MWGNDLFKQRQEKKTKKKTKSHTEHFGSRVKVRKYTHTHKKDFFLSPAGRYSSFLLYIHSPQRSLPQTKVFQLNLKRWVTRSTFPGENIFARTHSIWPHAVTWDEVFQPRWLPISLLLYVPLCTGCSDLTSVAWPREPQGPLSLAQRWPPEEAPHRGERASSRRTKGQCNVLAPHESSQAHGEHIRTSGFYLPFLFFFSAPRKESTGCQVCQVPHDRHAHGPKEPRVCILPISPCRVPCPRLATEALG